MSIGTINPPIILAAAGSSPGISTDVQPGDLLIGRVVGQQPDGSYLVDFNGVRSSADIRFPISIGETILTEVLEPGPPLKLKIQPPRVTTEPYSKIEIQDPFHKPTAYGRQLHKDITHLLKLDAQLPETLRLPGDIHQSLQRLESFLRPLHIESDAMAMISRLSTIISDSGLYFEKKLAQYIQHILNRLPEDTGPNKSMTDKFQQIFNQDLKPHLLILSKFLEQSESLRLTVDNHRQVNRVKTGVRLLLEYIGEQHRQQAIQRNDTHTATFFHHTVTLDRRGQTATLRFYHSLGKADLDQSCKRISILLNMTRMGSVRADLSLIEGNLQITFFVASDAIKQHFEKQLRKLSTLLTEQFATLICHVHLSRRRIDEFTQTALNRSGDYTVDLRI